VLSTEFPKTLRMSGTFSVALKTCRFLQAEVFGRVNVKPHVHVLV
jgi:hypothetical protein